MKIKQLAFAIAALALAAAAQASDSPDVAKAKLEMILSCEQGADPEEVATLITHTSRDSSDLRRDTPEVTPVEI